MAKGILYALDKKRFYSRILKGRNIVDNPLKTVENPCAAGKNTANEQEKIPHACGKNPRRTDCIPGKRLILSIEKTGGNSAANRLGASGLSKPVKTGAGGKIRQPHRKKEPGAAEGDNTW